MTEPRRAEVHVGSATNGLAPVSVAERSLAPTPASWLGLIAIAGAAVAADQLTKRLVAERLALGEEVEVAGPVSIHHVHNSGIAFGLFPSATTLVIVLTGLAVAWMLVFFARSGGRHPVLPVGLGLVVGGSAANLVDRLRLGHVTDFLDVGAWPAFNLADAFIVSGVALLLGVLLLAEREPRRSRRLPAAPGARP